MTIHKYNSVLTLSLFFFIVVVGVATSGLGPIVHGLH